MNTMTTHYDMNNTCRKGIHLCECLKMSKLMEREKKYSWQCFILL